MSESVRFFRIDSKDFVYLKGILEAYEGLATLTTADIRNGIVRISTPLSQKDDLDCLIDALGVEISLCEIPPPQPLVQRLSTDMEYPHA